MNNAKRAAWMRDWRKNHPAQNKATIQNWHAAHPERSAEIKRRAHLKHRYNITPEQWDEMLEAQGGCCAICGTDEPGGNGTFQVDHDHTCCPGRSCGECVRGLLCLNCNRCNFGVDPTLLRIAADYFETWSKRGS